MRLFKFGGASVQNATAIKNVARVLQYEGTRNTLVVISAMGKMTNAFEKIVDAYVHDQTHLKATIDFVRDFHFTIIEDLFEEQNDITTNINFLLGELALFFSQNTSKNFNYIYDQVVGYGELISTTIVSGYLNSIGVKNTWLDVRECILTDANYRDAKVNWDKTKHAISKNVDTTQLNITQGFLGRHNNETTTLGREGSDYTAGIFAYCLDASSVTIWKDVEGVLNADPRVFQETELLREISYTEAIEMAFYGASVIHPKTIQPLEQKQIPLYVRSFENLLSSGTKVSNTTGITPLVPCYIVKQHQILISISAKDFSFMVEDNIGEVFKKLHQYNLKVNLIQNSAISFSVCVDDRYQNFAAFYKDLKDFYTIKHYPNATLFTIRHFNNHAIDTIKLRGNPIIRQINTETAQLVIQENV